MAYTTPRTWNPGETVTAALMNAHLRDNLNAMSGKAIIVGFGAAGFDLVLTTGVKAYVEVPMSLRITGWSLVANESGSIVIDVWKDSWANFPPTVADTIAGSEKPTLSSAQKNQDLSLSTWDDEIDAGDVLAFNIDSVTTVEQVTLSLHCEPR